MKKTYQWILKTAITLMIVLTLVLSAAAMAAGADWSELMITLSWTDGNGDIQSADASPVTASEAGEGCFWVMLPSDAPLDGLTFSAYHPRHEYEFVPASGDILFLTNNG